MGKERGRMTRLLNSIAAALMIALVVFLFSGCGSDETAQTKASTRTSTAKASAKTPVGGTNKSENLVDQIIVPTDQTPKEFKRSLESRRPVVVTFYMTGPYDDSQVHLSVSSLESKYKGQVDFYTFMYSEGSRYGDLATLLSVNSTPTVVIINRQAKVQRAWTGYADTKSLEQGIVEATK